MLQELKDIIKRPNIGVMGVPEGSERETRIKSVFN